jgi:hypothetical protein
LMPCSPSFCERSIVFFSLYPFGPNRFQALHGASIRHSLSSETKCNTLSRSVMSASSRRLHSLLSVS